MVVDSSVDPAALWSLMARQRSFGHILTTHGGVLVLQRRCMAELWYRVTINSGGQPSSINIYLSTNNI